MTKLKKSDLVKAQKSAKRNSSETDFLIFKTKKAFIYLKKAFIKVLIIYHFDPERHIRIEIDLSGYTIYVVLNQITSDQIFSDHVIYENYSDFSKSGIDQWHPVIIFSRKMILAEMQYTTHDQKLLAII